MKQLLFLFLSLSITYASAENIQLDGTLSPGEWDEAVVFDLEYEVMPSRNTPSNLRTPAYVKYDEKYLYVGIKAYGDPEKIRATLKNRDQTWNEDYVALMAAPQARSGCLVPSAVPVVVPHAHAQPQYLYVLRCQRGRQCHRDIWMTTS